MRLPRRSLRFAFAGSLAIHLIAVLLLALHSTEMEVPPVPITFEYPAVPDKPAATQAGQQSGKKGGIGSHKKSTSNSRVHQMATSDFLPSFTMNQNERVEAAASAEDPQWSSHEKYDEVTLLGTGNTRPTEDIRFIVSLYREIDQSIADDPFLSEYNHTGQVYFQFEVGDDDRLDTSSLHASAKDRVLKVIAARAIRHAFRNENGDVHFAHKRIVLNARFSWSSHEACMDLTGINDNFMSFCHYAENKRKSFSGGEKVGTVLGSLWAHGPWAYDDIKEYNREQRRREGEFDPFAPLKNDPDWNL